VVASEVRNLASRSADAAKEIKSLIGASVEKVEVGARQVNGAGTSMDEIVAQVQRVTLLISEIYNATAEQTSGIGQAGDAVSRLDQVTQQNAALVEESAAAAESLRHQAAPVGQSGVGVQDSTGRRGAFGAFSAGSGRFRQRRLPSAAATVAPPMSRGRRAKQHRHPAGAAHTGRQSTHPGSPTLPLCR
jgi:methyl-accepting chemotaxis protein